MANKPFNEHGDESARILKICVDGGSDVLLVACGRASFGTLKAYTGPTKKGDALNYMLVPMEQPGVVIDAQRSYITHPADLINLARWVEDAAEWLAEQMGVDLYDEDEDEEDDLGYL